MLVEEKYKPLNTMTCSRYSAQNEEFSFTDFFKQKVGFFSLFTWS